MAVPLPAYVVQVRRVLWITLGVNVAIVLVKILLGLSSSSLAVLSDAAHSGMDSLNSLMGLLVMRLVRPYADSDHPYGHAKFEMLGTLGIAAFMLLTFFEIVSTSVQRLLSGAHTVHVTAITVLVFAVTIFGNLFIIGFEQREGTRLNSHFLLADVRHTMSDLVISAGIIIGLVLVAAGFHFMDAVASLVVAAVVAYSAYHVVRSAVPVLVDQAVHNPREIRQVAESIAGVQGADAVRTRGAGPGCFIELTINVNVEGLREAHHVADEVENALQDRFGPDCTVTVHVEPEHEA